MVDKTSYFIDSGVKSGIFREQVSYFEGFILKIAKKKINYTLFNSLDVI